jgi:hypothetical protein
MTKALVLSPISHGFLDKEGKNVVLNLNLGDKVDLPDDVLNALPAGVVDIAGQAPKLPDKAVI